MCLYSVHDLIDLHVFEILNCVVNRRLHVPGHVAMCLHVLPLARLLEDATASQHTDMISFYVKMFK